MLNQIWILSKVQLKNLFSINEIRYTKDKKKKQNFALLSATYIFVAIVAMGYIGGLAYAYHILGIGDIVPMYLYTILSLLMLMLSFFKAGSILFSMKSYDIMISLPVSKTAVLVSRFVIMYITNLLFSLVILVPGLTVHIWFAKPKAGFYFISLFVILLAPLLPLTISSILSAVIKAVSSRMKRKNLVEVFLAIILVIVPIALGTSMGEPTENMDAEALKEMIGALTDMLGSIFPPALWYHLALQGSILHFLLLILAPTLIFTLFVWTLSLRFTDICAGLNATYAKQNYKVTTLKSGSILYALFKKEMKLYFSSSLYVTNTIVGYVLAVILALSIATGLENLMESMIEGIAIDMLLPFAYKLLPFVVAMPLCMMSAAAASISMEGKYFWQLQVLPVKAMDIYHAKLLWNMALAAPFYTASVILLLIGTKPSPADALHYLLLPLLLLIFNIVFSLAANLWFPNFTWENEAQVIKQGAAVLVSMLGGMISILLPAVLTVVLAPTNYTLYYFAIELLLLSMIRILYRMIIKKELNTLPR